jgi:hypothetical protein
VNARWHWVAVPLILFLSAGIAGCGSASSSPTSAPATTAAAATTPAAATTTGATPAATGDTIPEYKPSTVTSSQHVGPASKTVLASPDSVEKVTAFYENALQSGGWQVEKTAKSGDTVEYKAIKGAAAAEIEISPAGTGASITVKVIT